MTVPGAPVIGTATAGNAPSPGDGGVVNIVSGTAGGQCAALATR